MRVRSVCSLSACTVSSGERLLVAGARAGEIAAILEEVSQGQERRGVACLRAMAFS